jgi:hypothetical protein
VPPITASEYLLSNIGIGHGAVDGGVGYTYFDPKTGHEFSGVLGFTYNTINPDTQYQNGVETWVPPRRHACFGPKSGHPAGSAET